MENHRLNERRQADKPSNIEDAEDLRQTSVQYTHRRMRDKLQDWFETALGRGISEDHGVSIAFHLKFSGCDHNGTPQYDVQSHETYTEEL